MPGGTRSYEMGRRIAAEGHEVHIVTSRQGRQQVPTKSGWYETQEAGMNVHWLINPYSNKMSFQRRIRAFFSFAWKSMRKAASLGGEVVFATSTPLTIAIPALYASRKNRIPMVFEVRDLWPEGPIAVGALKNPLSISAARLLERKAYFGSVHVVALSEGMKEGVIATGYPEERVTVIPNSSDIDIFRVPPKTGLGFLKKYPHLSGGPLVSYIGTLGLINGVDYLVEIAKEMLNVNPTVRFLIVGDGREKELVRNRAVELGVLRQNLWMMPQVPKREVPALLSASTVATSLVIDMPHKKHNSANKVFDTFAAGKPLVINHGGWIADILQESGAGLVIPPRDAVSASRQIHKFIINEETLRRAEISSAELADTRFNRDKLARQLLNTLESTITSGERTFPPSLRKENQRMG